MSDIFCPIFFNVRLFCLVFCPIYLNVRFFCPMFFVQFFVRSIWMSDFFSDFFVQFFVRYILMSEFFSDFLSDIFECPIYLSDLLFDFFRFFLIYLNVRYYLSDIFVHLCCTCKVAILLIRPIVFVFSPSSLRSPLLSSTQFYILFEQTINIIESFAFSPG